CQQSRKIPWTF
nr:immunoglobulin light chain junction region [Mus musculus]NSL97819.1 immunoglobulin light chain junction region [Mus musculus]NSL98204.1 immunoglobulin light chain junction region [Mus musculus]NSL98346.1 immunoglobulin light chain junction region [Mus musculus]NSL98350.1 immunoglobulin light chain junction region [Mus musculus]